MDVSKVIETEDGMVHFRAKLQGAELEAVISVGLNVLLQTGALPYMSGDNENIAGLVEGTGTEQ